jgi:hypothetical protein
LDDGEPERMEDELRGLYASIPYQLHMQNEAYYQTIFLTTMQFLGFRVAGEVQVSEGRIDGTIERPNGMTYVVEFKYRKASDDTDEQTVTAMLDDGIREALAQIEDRGYANRYAGTRREVFKVAVCVSGRGHVMVVSKAQ